jgi:hypothetical protein
MFFVTNSKLERIKSEEWNRAIHEAAYIAGCYKRDASFDDSIVGAMEHNSNQGNIARAILEKLKS